MATTITRSVASLSWIDPKTSLPEYDQGNPGSTVGRCGRLRQAEVPLRQLPRRPHHRRGPRPDRRGPRHGRERAVSGPVLPEHTARGVRLLPACATVLRPGDLHPAGGGPHPQPGVHRPRDWGERQRRRGLTAAVAAGVGPAIGRKVGGWAGHAVAAKTLAFPPIWTEVDLTIYADGTATGKLLPPQRVPQRRFYSSLP